MAPSHPLVTGAAALLFALVFLFGDRIHLLRSMGVDARTVASFGAGVAVAYAFVQVMPELDAARGSLRTAAEAADALLYDGMGVYFFALAGFLVFYGLENLHRSARGERGAGPQGAFRLHIAGFAAYVWLVSYQLVAYPRETRASITLYAVAMLFHFIGVDRMLREQHGDRYDRVGRYVLASVSPLGWAAGLLVAVPAGMLALSVGFVSGAVIVNSAIMELPSDTDGRFLPFLVGGLAYGLFLLPLG